MLWINNIIYFQATPQAICSVLWSQPPHTILGLFLFSSSLQIPFLLSFLFPFAFVLSLDLRTCLLNAGIISYLSKDIFCLFFFFSYIKHLCCNLPSLLAIQLVCNLTLSGLSAHQERQYRVCEEKANNSITYILKMWTSINEVIIMQWIST